MAGYSKMEIMSMSEEEICRILKEEGETLPDRVVYLMVEELKKRKECASAEGDSEESEMDESQREFLENWEAENGEEEDFPEEPTPEEEEEEEELSEEERQAKKREKELLEMEKVKKERSRTLLFAFIGAGVTAAAIVGFFLYLFFTGELN